jgi:Flp pilus assembly protein TadG
MFMNRTFIREDIGQAFIELALALPIFAILLIGSAEFAILASAGIQISNAARAGVAYGAQNHVTASDTPGMQLAATHDAPNITGLTATATQSCTCVSSVSTTSITCSSANTSCVSPSRIVEYVQVNTSAAVTPPIHLWGLPTTFTMRGQAIMMVEQ